MGYRRLRPASWRLVRLFPVLLVVAIVLTPMAATPRAGLPAGASAVAPVQQSGSASDAVASGGSPAKLAVDKRDQPRPPGAVPDATTVLPVQVRPAAPEHEKPMVRQQFTGPAIDPKATERPQDRTATTQTFQNPDGSRTLRVFPGQRFAQRPDGWQPVDLTLSPQQGRLRPKTPGADVGFATAADDPALARLAFDATHVLAYGLDGAAPVPGRAEGAQVTYAGARPGVDVRLAATPAGLTEELVLAGRDAPASYTYTLALTGLEPRLNPAGDVELAAGDKVFGVLPAGLMWDAATPAARSSEVHYGLERTGPGTWKLSLDLDPAWLHDPARVFPVTVDPSAGQFNADTDDTYVRSDNGARNSQLLAAGRTGGALNRSYLHLGSALGRLRNDFIIGGTLDLKAVDASNAGGLQLSAFEVTQPWSGSPAWPGSAVGRLLGQSGPVGSSTNPSWVGVPLDPNVLTDWSHGTAMGNGVSVRAANEAAATGILFQSADSGGTQVPYLDVRYAPDGASYQVTDVLQPTNNTAGWMTVQVTNRGATTWNGGYHFGYWIQETNTLYQGTALPAVGPGGVTTLSQVPIGPLPPGKYHVVLSMWDPAGQDFASADGVPNAVLDLDVNDVAPTSNYQQPASGEVVETLTPTLYAQGIDPDDWPAKGLTYKFRLCSDPAFSQDCRESGWGGPSWSPAANTLYWGKTYYWGVLVDDTAKQTPCWVGPAYDPNQTGCVVVADSPSSLRFTTRVAQPEITSHLAGSPGTVEGPGLDPQIGNYSLANTDSAVSAVGPALGIDRTYNSLDPRRDTAFGLGWASRLDMKLAADGDGSGNVVLTYPDGRQLRFGHNPDDSYTSPLGDSTRLDHKNSGSASFTLRDATGSEWLFDASLRLSTIIDPAGLRQNLHYATGTDRIDTITNAIANGPADRTLSLTWTGTHVTSVAEPAPSAGAPAPTWTYTYTGDQLTGACAPGAAPNCTTYGYTTGSHYRSSVADDKPQAYYRFDEQPNATTTLASAVALHPGGENATAHGVLTGSAPGPLAGTSDGAATFGGNGYVVLPQGLTTETMSPSVEMWFKTTGSGTLFALQDKDFAPGAGAGTATPVLYVGTDGLLYGGFPRQPGSGATQVVSHAAVNDGAWHHAALSAAIGSQTLYLDGVAAGSVDGLIDQKQLHSAVLGAGYAKGYPATNDGDFFLNGGSIDEAAIYRHTLGALAVADHFAAAKPAGELTSVKLPQDNRSYATLTYDDLTDRVATLVDHQGLKWTMDPATVDETQDTSLGYPRWVKPVRTAVVHGPAGYGEWTYTFDAAAGGRLVTSTHNGATRRYEYNTAGFPSATVDEEGHRFEQTTDDRGNVLSRKSCRDVGVCNTSYYSYLTPSNPLDPRGNKLATSSDARSSGPTDPTYQTTYSYDGAGRPTGTTSPVPNGQTQRPSTSIVYSDGTPAAVGGGTVPAGLPVKATGARGQVTTYQYYRNGDLAETDDPAGLRTQHTYDALGRVLTTTTLNGGGVAFGVTTFTYTPRSLVATQTDPAVTNPITGAVHAKVTTYGYDGDGNVTGITESDTLPPDQGGDQPRAVTVAYDEHDRPKQTTHADSGVEKYSYSADALTTSTTDVRGFVWTSTDDELGRLRSTAISGTGVDPQDPSQTSMGVETRTYTPAGHLQFDTDAMGRTTAYSYWGDGLPQTTVAKDYQGPDGTTRDITTGQFAYDPAGHLATEVTAGGITTTTTYDPAGLPVTTTFDPATLKRTTTYTRDPDGNPLTVQVGGAADPSRVETTSYSYDPAGRVGQETDRLSATAAFTVGYIRDERGLPTTITDRRGLATTYTYDGTGAPVTTTHPAADVWQAGQKTANVQSKETLGRNAFGEVTQAKDAAGGVTLTGRDAMGRAVSGTLPAYTPPGSSTPIVATTTTGYDPAGNVTSQTDPLGRQTTRTYDPYNRVATTTAPQVGDTPSVSAYGYDRMGELSSVTTPSGARHQFTYDRLGRQITSTQVDRSSGTTAYYTTTTAYDDAGNARSVTTPMGEKTVTSYDAAGAPLQVTDPTGRVTGYGYDNDGRQASVTAPSGLTTTTGFDLLGRATTVSQAAAGKALRSTTIGYDANGNATSMLSPEGRLTTVGYDALDRPVSQVEKVDATHSITTSTGYDALGNRSHAVDGNGHATDYTSNPWGRPESTIEPATAAYPNAADRTWTTSYDAAGQAVRQTEPGGIVRTRTFDAQGRLALETGAGAEAATADRKLGYDLDGNIASQTGPSGTTTYHYDDRGNLRSYTGPVTAGTYTYDGDNRLTGRTDAAGAATFGYDPAGRLASAVDPVTGRTMAYGYDPAGRLASVTDDRTSKTTARTIGYDSLDRIASDQLTQVPEAGVPPVTKLGVTYGYDLDDHVKSRTDLGTGTSAANTYGYDGAGRLSSWTGPDNVTTTYGWDDAGNRTSAGGRPAAFNERNQLVSGGGASYTYTARGTQASFTGNGQTTQSASDAFDRQVTHGQAQYGYDSLDRVATRNGADFGYDGLTNNQVSADGRVIERLPDGTPLSDKAAGGSLPGRVLFRNQHGDVVGRYLGGIVDGQKTYDPFGTVTASSGETSSLGYQGSYTDPDTAQVDMAARWYTPGTGQFASRDSVDVAPSPSWASNKYAYGNADPVSNADPSGHASCGDDWLNELIPKTIDPRKWAKSFLRSFLWSQTGGNCAPQTGRGCGDTITRADGSPCPGFEICNGSVIADWQSCPGGGGTADACAELAGPACRAYVNNGGGPGPGSPVRFRPPMPPPPPPLWLVNIGRTIARPDAGSTVTNLRDGSYPTQPAPGKTIDPGPQQTADDTEVTQETDGNSTTDTTAKQPLRNYDLSGVNENECITGPSSDVNDIEYGPLERGVWQDKEGKPVLNPRTGDPTFDRATGAVACLRVVRTGDRSAPPRPDGYDKDNSYANASGHLIAWIFHGADALENVTPINQNKTNSSLMYHAVEKQIRKQVEAGTPIYYEVTPVYPKNSPVPLAIHIYARGTGFDCIVVLQNSPVRDPTNRGCRDAAA